MSLRFCANLSFMFQEEVSLLKRYALAANCGFKGVECAFPYDYPIEEVVRAKEAAGVDQVLINTPVTEGEGSYGLAAVEGKERECIAGVTRAVDYATALGCKMVHLMAGVGGNLDTYRSNVVTAAELCAPRGITVVLEPICHAAVPGYFLSNVGDALRLVSEVARPNVRLQLDLFHMQQTCGDLTRWLSRALCHTAHVQIAQVPDRHEPDSPGELDYRYLLSLLDKLGYSGWIGLEYRPAGTTRYGLSWINNFGYKL